MMWLLSHLSLSLFAPLLILHEYQLSGTHAAVVQYLQPTIAVAERQPSLFPPFIPLPLVPYAGYFSDTARDNVPPSLSSLSLSPSPPFLEMVVCVMAVQRNPFLVVVVVLGEGEKETV